MRQRGWTGREGCGVVVLVIARLQLTSAKRPSPLHPSFPVTLPFHPPFPGIQIPKLVAAALQVISHLPPPPSPHNGI